MQLSSNPFEWLGEALGTLVRIVVDSLAWVFNILSGASTAFVNGFSRALGVDSNVFTVVAVIIGLLLIYAGVRSILRRRFVAAVVWLLLGLWLLSALIN